MSLITPFSRMAREHVSPQDPTHSCPIRSIILLNGAIGADSFSKQVCRSILDLPLGAGLTVMGLWRRHLLDSRMIKSPGCNVRLINSHDARLAQGIEAGADPMFRCEHDPVALRGTAGVLRDITVDYADDAYVLVMSAAQILFEPLNDVIAAMVRGAPDVSFFVHEDGTPTGVALLRCRCLRCLPEIGFVDFKEQALPKIASAHCVNALRTDRIIAAPIRTAEQYIRALRMFHQAESDRAGGGSERGPAFAEDWGPVFEVVEDGAIIEPQSRIHDSVILAGARIGSGALVARSVIGPGAIILRGAVVVDQIIGHGDVRSTQRGRV
jgi:hypothetical protein